MKTIINDLEILKEFKKKHQWYYTFKCVCGVEATSLRKHIQSGHTKSCGCRRAKVHQPKSTPLVPQVDIEAKLYNQYVRDANTRGISFNISKRDFINLTSQCCTYCGQTPQNKCQFKGDTLLYNGLDRIDNNKDYELTNVTTCCTNCNLGKGRLSKEDFLNWIQKVYAFNFGLTINSVNSVNISSETIPS